MNISWILFGALLLALCLPQQPAQPDASPGHPITVFEKSLSSDKRLIVTADEHPFTPAEEVERQKIIRSITNGRMSDHRYFYSYFTVTRGGTRTFVWSEDRQMFGADPLGKASEGSMSIEVYDVVLQDNVLFILYKQSQRTEANIVHLHSRPGTVSTPPGSESLRPIPGKNVVQSPIGNGRVLEEAGPEDAVGGGRFLKPILNGEVTVELSHIVKQRDGSVRKTFYHLRHTPQNRERWESDPSNIYMSAEKPGIQLDNSHP